MKRTLRVIVIAAHPDEPEEYAGGTAALYARQGHAVKFMTLTNGSAGHHVLDAPTLVARRAREAALAADRLGVAQYEILDIDDGSLIPTLEVRQAVIRSIREWRADVVISFHADGGGHPDNRASGVAVRDALPFVVLGNILPTVAPLKRRPLHLQMVDYGTHDLHRHDLAIDIGQVLEDKLLGCDAHATQFYEFAPHSNGWGEEVPEDWAGRREFILKNWSEYFHADASMRESLTRWYGPDARAEFAETFHLARGNRSYSDEELRELVPMLGD
ncbi:PIG-L deacetylase family protein [Nonomuraea soli]|uniref:LmbE family N-acetylglucosaminyl deacetylase n=1 Tax=Nonomuraea soli TaxID=1032476 RepID=A0A7W0CNS7_9ACTN|nr:PIG-L deacetylase family protein [Nonomuraea soli]MBA2894598.1 LmbE family N-acetylglucosaminyl deacetylase [Nonomuraea soli]